MLLSLFLLKSLRLKPLEIQTFQFIYSLWKRPKFQFHGIKYEQSFLTLVDQSNEGSKN